MQNLLTIFFSLTAIVVWLLAGHRRAHRARRSAFEDRLLWVGLAAGLFDSAECPATSRLEIALAAIARKLGLRAGLVTIHGRSTCRIVATAGIEASLLRGLGRGTEVSGASLYFGTLVAKGQSIAIDYASLTEWRRHPACRERGWESCIAVNCGLEQGEDVVVSFFDTSPRGAPFTRSERALIEQLAPWIMAMVGEHDRESHRAAGSGLAESAPWNRV